MAAAAILNLFESKIAPLDPPSPKTPPYNQTWSGSDDRLRRYRHLKFFQDGGGRHLEFIRIEDSAIRSAVPENPTLEPNSCWRILAVLFQVSLESGGSSRFQKTVRRTVTHCDGSDGSSVTYSQPLRHQTGYVTWAAIFATSEHWCTVRDYAIIFKDNAIETPTGTYYV